MGAVLLQPTAARGADVSEYSVSKGRLFTQTSAVQVAPTARLPYAFRFAVYGQVSAVTKAGVIPPPPFATEIPLPPAGTNRFLYAFPGANLAALNLFFADGTYLFKLASAGDGSHEAGLAMSGSAFPVETPMIANYEAAQGINAGADFTLNFNGSESGRFELEIEKDGAQAAVLLRSMGGGGSFVIPAGALAVNSKYKGKLRFLNVLDEDTTSYPGATGLAYLYNETEFAMVTAADAVPPALASANPAPGSSSNSPALPVIFTFSEAMQPVQAIEWSANVNAGSLSYDWLSDRILRASALTGFPANATINWKLNPAAGNASNFRDKAGNALPMTEGSFGTSAAPDPCAPETNGVPQGFAVIQKGMRYTQTGNADPVPDVAGLAFFSANYRATPAQVVSGVTLAGTKGTIMLTNLLGIYSATLGHATMAQLEAAAPAGSYTLTATGAGSATLTLPALAVLGLQDGGRIRGGAQGKLPHISNLAEFAATDPSQPFTLRFENLFAGERISRDMSLAIEISDGAGADFSAPDACKGIELGAGAVSVVIPANTFKLGSSLRGSIAFARTVIDEGSIPLTVVSAGVAASSRFEVTLAGGGQAAGLKFTEFTRSLNGTIRGVVTADPGTTVVIEVTEEFRNWTAVSTNVIEGGRRGGGTAQFSLDSRASSHRYYRAAVVETGGRR